MNPLHQVGARENEGSNKTHENLSGEVSEQVAKPEGLTNSLLEKNGDPPANKVSDLIKLSNLQTASTHSLLNVVRTILDENIEKSNAAMPMRVASLLKFTMQEIEQRVSKQSEDLRKQTGLNKSREDRHQTKIRALETLAMGTTEENKIIMNQLQQMKAEKARIEEEKKLEHQDMMRLLRENANYESQISSMTQELDQTKTTHENDIVQLKLQFEDKLSSMIQELDLTKKIHEDNISQQKLQYEDKISSMIQELDLTKKIHEDNISQQKLQYEDKISSMIQDLDLIKKTHEDDIIQLKLPYEEKISSMIQELDLTKKTHEDNIVKLKSQYEEKIVERERMITDLECFLADSMKKVKKLEEFSESKYMALKRKELAYKHFMDSHIGSIQDLRKESDIIKQEMLKTKRFYVEELCHLELELKGLVDAAQNYHAVQDENRRLYNEVQDLKGNIRVYCRIRPFHPSQSEKETTMDYIGENGELVVANPLKQGKDTHRMFKFNKVFGPDTTQEDVFRDTQPLIRSVLDGYNVCIFAYGQTGSGKTYTMTGPSSTSVENWGVNYRALNDLFSISQSRKSSIAYEVGVQMVEIYNELVRDLLSNESSPKRLEIWNTTQPNGLAVPDATMHEVKSTTDVLELMNIGLMNRAIGATAQNERSSRSHSVLTVHVRGTDLETKVTLRGNLHLVDLAGSERVDRTEATGERLREAQNINKSLSALGDVIFALAQKSPHVPYRNSKLTQLLQSSLGGQAKTLMFVQLNPDVESYSETISTLKFAERVSGVELGAARSNKEGKGVRELMEQVASLKESISQKDAEIGQLRHLKTNVNGDKRITNLPRYVPPRSPRRQSLVPARPLRRTSSEQSSGIVEKVTSGLANSSDNSDKHSEAGSQLSTDEVKQHKELFRHSRRAVVDVEQNVSKELESRSHVADLIERNVPKELESRSHVADLVERNVSKELESKSHVADLVERNVSKELESRSHVADLVERNVSKELESRPPVADLNDDTDLLRFGDGDDEERLSDISDSVLSMGTETDGSNSIVEYTLFPETSNPPSENPENPSISQKVPRPSQKVTETPRLSSNKSLPKASSAKKTSTASSSAFRSSKRWQ